MHRYRILLSLFLCLSFSRLPAQVRVVGKVNHPVDTVVTLLIPPTSLGGESRNVRARLSAGGEFRFAIRTNIATPAKIIHERISIPVFIVPDQSFSLEFTAGDGKTTRLRFGGPGGADNNFLHRYNRFLEEGTPPLDSNRLARSSAREFRQLMDQNRAAREIFLDTSSQAADTELAPQLLQWLQNDIIYAYANELLTYPSAFRDLHDGTKDRNPSAGYYSFLEGLQINNAEAILQDSYQQFLESFIGYKLEKPKGWMQRRGGELYYSSFSRYLYGPPLYHMQYLVFERTLKWLVEEDYMAEEYRSFMASKAPALLKQKLKKRRESPPKVYSMKSFSITGSPVLWEVLQFHDGSRPDVSHFNGRPTLLYFHARNLSRVGFAINYLKKLNRKLENQRDINICLVDVNGNFEEWQRIYSSSGYENHPFTHLSMNFFDDFFDQKVPQGIHPDMVFADANGIIVEALDWKPPVKRVLEIIKRIP